MGTISLLGAVFSGKTGGNEGKVSSGVCWAESPNAAVGRDSGHHCGLAGLIRETIKH